jgi:hypothetical protein
MLIYLYHFSSTLSPLYIEAANPNLMTHANGLKAHKLITLMPLQCPCGTVHALQCHIPEAPQVGPGP